ncbi:MAG: metallophosphoesterase family protein [Acidimicrobiia bacterium]
MRVALLSDIHGNTTALDAVLDDIARRGGADRHWVLGDLVALGPDPIGVLERITVLPGVEIIRGNTDRYVVTGERPPPSVSDAAHDPSLVPVVAEVAASFAWTAGCVLAGGWIEWLAELPTEVRLVLPDGTRFLGVHAAPGRDDGPGINPHDHDDDLTAMLDGGAADVVFAGHTHWPVDRTAGPYRAVNLGSVSNPLAPDLRASYVMVDAWETAHTIEHIRVEYDHEAVIASLEALNHPGRPWLIKHQRGEVAPRSGDP